MIQSFDCASNYDPAINGFCTEWAELNLGDSVPIKGLAAININNEVPTLRILSDTLK